MPGDNTIPILYRVDELRTGNTYATRSIKAMQRGKTIFICTASFAIPEASELEFQIKMPIVPPPDNYQSDEDIIRSLLEMPQYSEYHSTINLRLQQPFPVITKRVSRKDMPPNSETKQYIWVKSKENLGDDICLHQCIAAFLSDVF
jgi:acyl-CoA thioesterase II